MIETEQLVDELIRQGVATEVKTNAVERVSEADRMLLLRAEAEMLAAQRLLAFVNAHVQAVYHLEGNAQIGDDGVIIRAAPPVAE